MPLVFICFFFNSRELFPFYRILLKSYHNILLPIVIIGLGKTFNGSSIKFSEKRICLKLLRHFLLALFYWIFSFCLSLLLFSSSITCCKVLLQKHEWQTNLLYDGGILSRIEWIPLKAYQFNGVVTTSFLKNFVALMYLFVFDFLKLYW